MNTVKSMIIVLLFLVIILVAVTLPIIPLFAIIYLVEYNSNWWMLLTIPWILSLEILIRPLEWLAR